MLNRPHPRTLKSSIFKDSMFNHLWAFYEPDLDMFYGRGKRCIFSAILRKLSTIIFNPQLPSMYSAHSLQPPFTYRPLSGQYNFRSNIQLTNFQFLKIFHEYVS